MKPIVSTALYASLLTSAAAQIDLFGPFSRLHRSSIPPRDDHLFRIGCPLPLRRPIPPQPPAPPRTGPSFNSPASGIDFEEDLTSPPTPEELSQVSSIAAGCDDYLGPSARGATDQNLVSSGVEPASGSDDDGVAISISNSGSKIGANEAMPPEPLTVVPKLRVNSIGTNRNLEADVPESARSPIELGTLKIDVTHGPDSSIVNLGSSSVSPARGDPGISILDAPSPSLGLTLGAIDSIKPSPPSLELRSTDKLGGNSDGIRPLEELIETPPALPGLPGLSGITAKVVDYSPRDIKAVSTATTPLSGTRIIGSGSDHAKGALWTALKNASELGNEVAVASPSSQVIEAPNTNTPDEGTLAREVASHRATPPSLGPQDNKPSTGKVDVKQATALGDNAVVGDGLVTKVPYQSGSEAGTSPVTNNPKQAAQPPTPKRSTSITCHHSNDPKGALRPSSDNGNEEVYADSDVTGALNSASAIAIRRSVSGTEPNLAPVVTQKPGVVGRDGEVAPSFDPFPLSPYPMVFPPPHGYDMPLGPPYSPDMYPPLSYGTDAPPPDPHGPNMHPPFLYDSDVPPDPYGPEMFRPPTVPFPPYEFAGPGPMSPPIPVYHLPPPPPLPVKTTTTKKQDIFNKPTATLIYGLRPDELRQVVKQKATPTTNANIAVDEHVHKNVNIQTGDSAIGTRGIGSLGTAVKKTIIESGTTIVQSSRQTGAAVANSRFFPGGVMPIGNVDMVFPDIIINNANDINNANTNENKVASSNENANANPNSAANQNANQNFNEFQEYNEFKEFNEKTENTFLNFEEKKFFFVNLPGGEIGQIAKVPVPITNLVAKVREIPQTLQVTRTFEATTLVAPATTYTHVADIVPTALVGAKTIVEKIEAEVIQPVRTVEREIPRKTVVEEIYQTIIERIVYPGETVFRDHIKTVLLPGETVVLPGTTVTEEVLIPGETVVKEVQVPGPTVIEKIKYPGRTIIEKVRLPPQTITEERHHTVVKEVQLPRQTVTQQYHQTVQLPGETVIRQQLQTVQLPRATVTVPGPAQIVTVSLPAYTIVEEIHYPGETVVEYKTVELPPKTAVEVVQLPGAIIPGTTVEVPKTVAVPVFVTIPVTHTQPTRTITEKESIVVSNEVLFTLPPKTVTAKEEIIVSSVVKVTQAPETIYERIEVPVYRTRTEKEREGFYVPEKYVVTRTVAERGQGAIITVAVCVPITKTQHERILVTQEPITMTEREEVRVTNRPVTVTKKEAIFATEAPINVVEREQAGLVATQLPITRTETEKVYVSQIAEILKYYTITACGTIVTQALGFPISCKIAESYIVTDLRPAMVTENGKAFATQTPVRTTFEKVCISQEFEGLKPYIVTEKQVVADMRAITGVHGIVVAAGEDFSGDITQIEGSQVQGPVSTKQLSGVPGAAPALAGLSESVGMAPVAVVPQARGTLAIASSLASYPNYSFGRNTGVATYALGGITQIRDGQVQAPVFYDQLEGVPRVPIAQPYNRSPSGAPGLVLLKPKLSIFGIPESQPDVLGNKGVSPIDFDDFTPCLRQVPDGQIIDGDVGATGYRGTGRMDEGVTQRLDRHLFDCNSPGSFAPPLRSAHRAGGIPFNQDSLAQLPSPSTKAMPHINSPSSITQIGDGQVQAPEFSTATYGDASQEIPKAKDHKAFAPPTANGGVTQIADGQVQAPGTETGPLLVEKPVFSSGHLNNHNGGEASPSVVPARPPSGGAPHPPISPSLGGFPPSPDAVAKQNNDMGTEVNDFVDTGGSDMLPTFEGMAAQRLVGHGLVIAGVLTVAMAAIAP